MQTSLLLALVFLAIAALVHAAGSNNNLRKDEVEALNTAVLAPKPPRTKLKACWKEGESRGAGVLPEKETKTCPSANPEKSMGLCYPHCKNDKREGFGPLCWDNCLKTPYKSNGVIFCCDSDEICSQLVTDMAVKIPEALVKFAIDISVNPANVLKILRDLRALVSDALELELPLCENVKDTEIVDEPEVKEVAKEELDTEVKDLPEGVMQVEKAEPAVVVAEM